VYLVALLRVFPVARVHVVYICRPDTRSEAPFSIFADSGIWLEPLTVWYLYSGAMPCIIELSFVNALTRTSITVGGQLVAGGRSLQWR
jgi:hypothetical protein